MIPAEAVEAAAQQMAVNDGDLMGWVLYQSDAQKVLEAAAPHMLAASFDEAADDWAEAASWSDSSPSPEQVQRWLRSRANTYRTPDAV